MWTKNGKKIFLYRLLNQNQECTVLDYTNSATVFVLSGVKGVANYSTIGNTIGGAATSNHGYCIYCGSGDVEPAEDDYTLAEPLSLTYITGSISDTIINKVIQYTVQNDNTEVVTIRELGLFAIYSGKTSLLNRKILSTPITLAVGEQAIITFTIDTSDILDSDGWTNNFKMFANNQFLLISSAGTYTNVLNTEQTTNTTNYVKNILEPTLYNNYALGDITTTSNSSIRYKFGVYCGTGTTTPTENDITLEAPIILNCTSSSMTFDDNFNCLINCTLQNTSTETYTVTEIGLCAMVNSGGNNVLLNRRLLPTPVVMEPNDIYVFTYNINTGSIIG